MPEANIFLRIYALYQQNWRFISGMFVTGVTVFIAASVRMMSSSAHGVELTGVQWSVSGQKTHVTVGVGCHMSLLSLQRSAQLLFR